MDSGQHYETISKSMRFYRSCIMVEEQKFLSRFEELGIEKVRFNKDGVLIINLPLERINDFVTLNAELMQPGRWNEYVGPTTGFYFKMPNGQFRHHLLGQDTQLLIIDTLNIFLPGWKPESLWRWIAELDIYSDLFV